MAREALPERAEGGDHDLPRVCAILAGDEGEWHSFVDKYSDRILAAALRWCRPYCALPPSKCSVATPRAPRLLDRFLRSDCDEIADAYLFILNTIRSKVLPLYEGRCKLSTFLFALLNPIWDRTGSAGAPGYGYHQLFADFMRAAKGKKRIRPPVAIRDLSKFEQRVFDLMCRGEDDAAMTGRLRLRPEDAERLSEVRSRIEEVLLQCGWEHYWHWLGHLIYSSTRPASLDEVADNGNTRGVEVADLSADVSRRWEIVAGKQLMREAWDTLDKLERRVLLLRYHAEWGARAVAQELGISERQVYSIQNSGLRKLAVFLQARISEEGNQGEGRLKRVLDDWGKEFALDEDREWLTRLNS